MPWHIAEHVACVLWARPERAFCTCVRTGHHVVPRPLLACRAAPRPHPLTRTRQLAPHALQRRRQRPLGGTPTATVRPAMDGAAQATTPRQLPS